MVHHRPRFRLIIGENHLGLLVIVQYSGNVVFFELNISIDETTPYIDNMTEVLVLNQRRTGNSSTPSYRLIAISYVILQEIELRECISRESDIKDSLALCFSLAPPLSKEPRVIVYTRAIDSI